MIATPRPNQVNLDQPQHPHIDPLIGPLHPEEAACRAAVAQQLWEIFGVPNPWDFLEAATPEPGQAIRWRTVNTFPLRPRSLFQRYQDPSQQIGTRPGTQISYALLDIDINSPHLENLSEIKYILETLGLCRSLLIRSSYSGGLHLYVPLPAPVNSFDLAVCLQQAFLSHNIPIKPGQLETFPNPKTYTNGSNTYSHYNGHRLPLQPGSGSCLLDSDLTPIGSSLEQFWSQWATAAAGQDLELLTHALRAGRTNRRRNRRRSAPSKSAAWQQDLLNELNEGWSGPGQTNRLLKVLGTYHHVFEGLSGAELEARMAEQVQEIPGYREHCNHQSDIKRRIHHWRISIEKYYWPQGDPPKVRPSANDQPQLNQNQLKQAQARNRIIAAYSHLEQNNALPECISTRASALHELTGCSKSTLYRPENLALWHPEHRLTAPEPSPEPAPGCEQSPEPPETQPFAPPSSTDPEPNPRSPEPSNSKDVHTLEETMKCVSSDLAASGQNQSSDNGGARGGDESSFPQPESPAPDDDLEQKLMALHQAMVESGQVNGGQVEPDLGNEAQPAPVTTSNPQPDPEPRTNAQSPASVPVATPNQSPAAPVSESCHQGLASEPTPQSTPDSLSTEFGAAAAPESGMTVKQKPKPKPKLKTKVKPTPTPTPAPVSSRQPKLTKRQQAQAQEQVEVIIPGIQKCVVQLGWSGEQTSEFIQSRFNGRRRAELNHDELVLLLYRLQTELIDQSRDST